MSDAAMQVLAEAANKTEGTGWKNTLWYSNTLEMQMKKLGLVSKQAIKEREKQRKELRKLGYEIRAIEALSNERPVDAA